MKVTRAVVPSLFTILNIFCGFLSLLSAQHGDYVQATWFILAAGIFDVLDGAMARLTKSFSEFGVELDSLCDVVSFGVAPSFIIYNIYLHNLGGFGMLIAAMPMMFGAMRLARFNSQLVGFDKDFFKGLPIPSAAIVVCAYVQRYFNPETGLDANAASMLAPLAVIVSLLMVSTIKYDSLPKFSRRGIVQHPLRFTFVIVCATAIILTQGKALFPCFVVYLATGPIRYIIEFAKRIMHPAAQHEEESVTSDV